MSSTSSNKFYHLRLLLIVFTMVFLQTINAQEFSTKAKTVLRQIGNELLLANNDSTSLILPITEVDYHKYQISFADSLSILPDKLVEIVDRNLKKHFQINAYSVQVLHCEDNEIAYSYEMHLEEEKTIIPCSGRIIPQGCYTVEISFLDDKPTSNNWFIYIVVILIFLVLLWIIKSKKPNKNPTNNEVKKRTLGAFIFYPEENKLVKKAKEITLSKKECEILELFVNQPNTIIRREELTKKVWEDNGVIVGRSLDTYISKLRKKLQEDDSIKLVNIHGVGYKLELK